MKKRLCSLFLLVMMLAFSGTVTAYADESDDSLVALEFEAVRSLPVQMPDEKLFTSLNFSDNGDGDRGLKYLYSCNSIEFESMKFMGTGVYPLKINTENEYKYVIYSDSLDVFYYNSGLMYVEDTDTYGSYRFRTSKLALGDVLQISCAMPQYSNYNFIVNPSEVDSIQTWRSKDNLDSCYVLVFPKDAVNLGDLLYKIPYSRLDEVVNWEFAVPSPKTASIKSVDVELLEPITRDGKTVGYKLQFTCTIDKGEKDKEIRPSSIGVYNTSGKLVESKDFTGYHFEDNSLVFTMDVLELENGDNSFIFYASYDNTYKGTFEVTGISDTHHHVDGDVDVEAPVVTYSGIPKEIALGNELSFQLLTDKPCRVLVDGKLLENGEYGTTFKVSVWENGNIEYRAISESGVETSGMIDITSFTDAPMATIAPVLPPTVVDQDGVKLEQTSVKASSNFMIYGLICGVIGLVVVIVFIVTRRKEDYDEKI